MGEEDSDSKEIESEPVVEEEEEKEGEEKEDVESKQELSINDGADKDESDQSEQQPTLDADQPENSNDQINFVNLTEQELVDLAVKKFEEGEADVGQKILDKIQEREDLKYAENSAGEEIQEKETLEESEKIDQKLDELKDAVPIAEDLQIVDLPVGEKHEEKSEESNKNIDNSQHSDSTENLDQVEISEELND